MKYVRTVFKSFDTNDHKYCKTIIEHITFFSDYISLNKYRNIKLLMNILKKTSIDKLIIFIGKYTFKTIDILVNHIDIIDYNMPIYVFKNVKIFLPIKLLYEKYGNNKHLIGFINSIKPNICKLTLCNVENLFNMFLIVCTKRFKGFERWGPGNHGNEKLNIINHFEKHVINGNENWNQYIEKDKYLKTAEQYSNFAIKLSRHMKNKIISTNGTKVYLSGLYGKILIVGRLNSNYELGISSCYIIHDENYSKKINTFEKNACFKL